MEAAAKHRRRREGVRMSDRPRERSLADQCREACIDQAPNAIIDEIDQLRKYDEPIRKALSDERERARFLANPLEVLRSLGIPVSGRLARHLERRLAQAVFAELERAPSLALPNGCSVRPRFHVRVTAPKRRG